MSCDKALKTREGERERREGEIEERERERETCVKQVEMLKREALKA